MDPAPTAASLWARGQVLPPPAVSRPQRLKGGMRVAAGAAAALALIGPAVAVDALTSSKTVPLNDPSQEITATWASRDGTLIATGGALGLVSVFDASAPSRALTTFTLPKRVVAVTACRRSAEASSANFRVWAADVSGTIYEMRALQLSNLSDELSPTAPRPIASSPGALPLLSCEYGSFVASVADLSGNSWLVAGSYDYADPAREDRFSSTPPLRIPITALTNLSYGIFAFGTADGRVALISTMSKASPDWGATEDRLDSRVQLIRFRSSGVRAEPYVFEAIGDDGTVLRGWMQYKRLARLFRTEPLRRFRLGPAVPWQTDRPSPALADQRISAPDLQAAGAQILPATPTSKRFIINYSRDWIDSLSERYSAQLREIARYWKITGRGQVTILSHAPSGTSLLQKPRGAVLEVSRTAEENSAYYGNFIADALVMAGIDREAISIIGAGDSLIGTEVKPNGVGGIWAHIDVSPGVSAAPTPAR